MLLAPESGDVIEQLHSQIARVFAGRAGDGKIREIFNSLLHLQHNTDTFSQYALLPLCFALLILHENYRVQESGGTFRFQYVICRLLAVIAALAAYSQICGLIVGIFGGSKSWMGSEHLLDALTGVEGSLVIAWKNNSSGFFGIGDIWKLVPHLLCVGCLLLSCLFAYVVGLLLSLLQHGFLMILLAIGKTCIVLTLVPGVGVASSWARSLAQLSAWSLVGKIITNLLVYRSIGQLDQAVASGHWIPLLKLSAEFIILGLSMALVPMFVHKIAAGVAPGGFISSIAKTMFAAKLLTMGRGMMASRAVAGANPEGGPRRPHKVDRAAPRSFGARGTFVGGNAASTGVGSVVRAMRIPKTPPEDKLAAETAIIDRPPQGPDGGAAGPSTKPEREERIDALRTRSKEVVEPLGAAHKPAPVAVPKVISAGKSAPMRVAPAAPAPKMASSTAGAAGQARAAQEAAKSAQPASAAPRAASTAAAPPAAGGAASRSASKLQVAGAQPPRKPRIFIQQTPRGGMRASRLPPAHDTEPDGGPPALRREAQTSGEITS